MSRIRSSPHSLKLFFSPPGSKVKISDGSPLFKDFHAKCKHLSPRRATKSSLSAPRMGIGGRLTLHRAVLLWPALDV